MAEHKNVSIIAFVGLSGSGKSAASTYLGERGIPRVSFADAITHAVNEADLEPTPQNELLIREKQRLDPQGDLLAMAIMHQIDQLIDAGQHKIVIDGLGSWATYRQLKHEYPGSLIVVALTSSRRVRHRRLDTRADHPLTAAEVDIRDYDAIETLGKGGVIAIADHFIHDDGSLEQLHTQIDTLLRTIEF